MSLPAAALACVGCFMAGQAIGWVQYRRIVREIVRAATEDEGPGR